MACGVCGDPGHNRRTHSAHEPVQGEALIDQPGTGEPVTPTGAERAREALRARREAAGLGLVDEGPQSLTFEDPAGVITTSTGADDGDLQHPEFAIEGFTVEIDVVGGLPSFEGENRRTPDAPASSVVPDEEDQDVSAGHTGAPPSAGYPFDVVLDGEPATVTEHDCEPAPDQVWFCRHCGANLPNADLPIPPWRTVLGPDEPIRITLPGVWDLTAEQYHDIQITGDWLSNSDVKALLKSCPAQFHYDRWNNVRKTSDAFDFGHVWHNRVLGKGEAYQVFEPKKLDGRTKEGKAQRAEVDACRAAGVTPIYGDQFALIEAMAQAIEADPVPHALLTAPGRQEVCLFWYETIKVTNPRNKLYGQTVKVKRRAMVDHLPDMPEEDGATVVLVDGKTAEDVKPDDDMRKKIYDYAYHRQAETYAAAVEALFNRVADVVFIFQSKKPPHLIVPVDLDTPSLRVAAAENRQAMEIWAECVATGIWPGYVTNGIATSGVPAWIERQYEDEMVIC